MTETLEEQVEESTPVKVRVTEEQMKEKIRKKKKDVFEKELEYITGLMKESMECMFKAHVIPVYEEFRNKVESEGFEAEFKDRLDYIYNGFVAGGEILFEVTQKENYDKKKGVEDIAESDNAVLAIELKNMKTPYEGLFGLDDYVKEFEETLDSGNGVILCGEAGCGKTELIRGYIKKHLDDTVFKRIKPNSILDKYIGESENKLNKVFEYIGKNDGILIIDEGDWMFNRRDSESNSKWDNKFISAVLGELDGLDKSHKVRLIVTTNRLELLDPAFLRAGRFGEIIEIPMPDEEVRYKIIEHNLDKMLEKGTIRSYNLNLDSLAKATECVCPADIVKGLFESLPRYCQKNNITDLGEKELYGFFDAAKDVRMKGLYMLIKEVDKGQKGKCLARDIGYA